MNPVGQVGKRLIDGALVSRSPHSAACWAQQAWRCLAVARANLTSVATRSRLSTAKLRC
jgi:hypothetical protein